MVEKNWGKAAGLPPRSPSTDLPASAAVQLLEYTRRSSRKALALVHAYLTQNIMYLQTFFEMCMRVGAPETQNNTLNPRKSVVFIICPL